MWDRARRLGAVALVALAACTDDDGGGSSTFPTTGPPESGSALSPTTDIAPPTSAAATTTTVPGTTTTTPLPVDTGDLGTLDGAVAADGTLDLDAALSLFAAGYAPLPGVEPAPGAPIDGGPVLRTVLAAGDELGDEQRAVVGAVVDPPGEPLDTILANRRADRRLRAAARVTRSALEAFGGARGRPLSDDISVTLLLLPYDNGDGTHNFSSPRSAATAIPFGDGSRPYTECRIRVNADQRVHRRLRFADPRFVSVVAQEAYHCLQYEVVPFAAGAPQWVVEGAAAYAGEDFAGGSRTSSAWWRRWVTQPQRPLDRRTYDAIGFFSLLPGATNPYAFADALLTDPSVDSVRRRLEASDVFDRWGLAYATRPRWGPAYRMTGPGAPATLRAPRKTLRLRVDQARRRGRRVGGGGGTRRRARARHRPRGRAGRDRRSRRSRRLAVQGRAGDGVGGCDAGLLRAPRGLRVSRRAPRLDAGDGRGEQPAVHRGRPVVGRRSHARRPVVGPMVPGGAGAGATGQRPRSVPGAGVDVTRLRRAGRVRGDPDGDRRRAGRRWSSDPIARCRST